MSELINNREERQRILKELIRELHDGKTVDQVKERFKTLLDSIGATELSAAEQKLIQEGMPAEEVKRLCDVHVQVFRESLDEQAKPETTPGHPVHTFILENRAMENVIAHIQDIIKELRLKSAGDDVSDLLGKWRKYHTDLLDIIKHFSRKENILFPYLEKKGISGPSTVMWAIHDEIRAELKKTKQLLEESPSHMSADFLDALDKLVEPMHHRIKELFYKEENIMFPTALEVLSEAEWVEIFNQSDDIGYALITPQKKWVPRADGDEEVKEKAIAVEGGLRLDTGVLTQLEIERMLNTLPMDITFVDANDQVKYFSRGSERIFERTPAIIGRKVQFCHPQSSVHVVEKIVSDFKDGKRDNADFWINMGGRMIYIRYFAVRDKEGQYMGCLEVTQNVTEIRTLEGEKRIYDDK
jgi:DUF438 domain-containing protein